jgi:hypothetical protein
LIQPYEYDTHLPLLASQAFCGGPDILFAARNVPLLVLACHEFDLHVEIRDPQIGEIVQTLACERGLVTAGAA